MTYDNYIEQPVQMQEKIKRKRTLQKKCKKPRKQVTQKRSENIDNRKKKIMVMHSPTPYQSASATH